MLRLVEPVQAAAVRARQHCGADLDHRRGRDRDRALRGTARRQRGEPLAGLLALHGALDRMLGVGAKLHHGSNIERTRRASS